MIAIIFRWELSLTPSLLAEALGRIGANFLRSLLPLLGTQTTSGLVERRERAPSSDAEYLQHWSGARISHKTTHLLIQIQSVSAVRLKLEWESRLTASDMSEESNGSPQEVLTPKR